MSHTHISRELRERVSLQARHRCGYCLTAEAVVGTPMEVDHLIPESLGGLTEEQNLWLACSLCNNHKADHIAARDPETDTVVRLFDPRRDLRSEHFRWTKEGDRIVGLTPTGRATVLGLQLNRPTLLRARSLWVSVGWHPPGDAVAAPQPNREGENRP